LRLDLPFIGLLVAHTPTRRYVHSPYRPLSLLELLALLRDVGSIAEMGGR
jgi:hypothetical protein